MTTPTFLLYEILLWALAKPTCLPILKSLPSVFAEILKGNPKFWGTPVAEGHVYFSSGCNFMMGLGKPKLFTKLKSLATAVAKILKGNSKILGSSPSPWPRPLFLLV